VGDVLQQLTDRLVEDHFGQFAGARKEVRCVPRHVLQPWWSLLSARHCHSASLNRQSIVGPEVVVCCLQESAVTTPRTCCSPTG
jgi:hypothetical protein